MLTFATCLYRPDVYERVCLPALQRQADEYHTEILTDSDDGSIFAAYERMRQRVKHDTIVYLHDDVELMDDDTAPRVLRLMNESEAGLLGVVGSSAGILEIPWWTKPDTVGAWCWQRPTSAPHFQEWGMKHVPYAGQRMRRRPFAPAENMDGIFLADRTNLPWSQMDGWHGYDIDRCQQAKAAGYGVVVGDVMVCHHNQPHTKEWGESIPLRIAEMRDKWRLK